MIPDQRVWCAACAQHHLYPAITGPRLPAPDLAPEWRTAAARLAELEQAARAVACRLKQRGWIPADCDETRRLRDALGLGPDPMGEEVEDDRELTARAFEMVKARFPEAMNLAVTINRERDDAGYVQTQLVIIVDLIEGAEAHECQPEGDPIELPQHTVWTCPVDGRQWTVTKRMIGRKMYGQWVPRRVVK